MPPRPAGFSRAGAGRVRLPFIRHVPLAGWGPFLKFGSRTAEEEDLTRLLHARALVLEDPKGERVALCSIDLHGGSRYITEKAATLLADESFHPGNLFVCGTHNHAGPGGLYASPYYDAFAASTGIFSVGSLRVGFNQTLADELALRVATAVRDAVKTLRPARIGSSHGVKLKNWSRQRSQPALVANFPGLSDQEIVEQFKELSGGEDLERAPVDARVQTIAAFEAKDGEPRLIGSFSTWSAHCALLSREHETQSADYFGEAATSAETKHPGAVIAVAAGSIGDCDPLPPGLDFETLLERRGRRETNEAVVRDQAKGLAGGLLEAIADAGNHQAELRTLSPRLLENRIASASVDGFTLAALPQIGIPTLAGSELGTGDIRVFFMVDMREGVRQRIPDTNDAHWSRTQSNKDDRLASFGQRTFGRVAAALSFRTTRPFLEEQYPCLPVRYLELELADRTLGVLGIPGEPTTWLAAQLARLTKGRTLVAGVTGEYAGYFTTEAEYGVQHYEGSSTIWGRHTERWLTRQVKRLVDGEGTAKVVDAPHFKVLRERWVTRIQGDSGTFTRR